MFLTIKNEFFEQLTHLRFIIFFSFNDNGMTSRVATSIKRKIEIFMLKSDFHFHII